jgi:transposase
MKIKELLSAPYQILLNWPKKKVIKALEILREKYKSIEEKYKDLEKKNKELSEENAKLKAKLINEKVKQTNKKVNQPSSKQPEWEDKPGVGNDGKGKKKGRGKKGRKGAGNKRKDLHPDREEVAHVEQCDMCGKDLKNKKPLKSKNERIIEDIPEPTFKPQVILIKQEKKYCEDCKQVITAKSELALPKSDIGINATVLICYLWVALCLPFTKMSDYLKTFYGLKVSTSGLSKHVIRISTIVKDVYEEILTDVKMGVTLYADETGWRVKGKNWWLWVFGTNDAAYFTVDKSRGSKVVRRVMGEIFLGVLVVDGWHAYLKLICEQQSCMAHLLRKIRKFRSAFPHLVDIAKFYVKLRRIIRDGERLQANREKLGEVVFQRRLVRLKKRLGDLLKWPNPDDVLKDIIKKVKRQQPRILTFVEHDGVPCHNNFAEYLIRIGVLKRKISGGSLSSEGANAYAILLSIYVTCKLRGISFPKFMKKSLTHYIRTGKPMLLKTYADIIPLKKAA